MKNNESETKLTPMMKQYLSVKREHPDEILFFRMGDFYEMFLDDAKTASKILDIALTSRQDDVPMCGIPYHAAESYLARLIKAGHRVAICEQMETVPSEGSIVKREVIRVMTPGTVIESNLLQSDGNNYLASIVFVENTIGLAFIDISTGDFYLSSIERKLDIFRGELARYNPNEVIVRKSDMEDKQRENEYILYIKNTGIPVNSINEWFYDKDYSADTIKDVFKLASLEGLGITDDAEIKAAGSILQYIRDTHKKAFTHLKHPRRIISSDYMILDDATISNLELIHNDNSKTRTLFSVLNYTRTAMGRRSLERNLLHPLLIREKIENRLNIVQYLYENPDTVALIQQNLKEIHDIERLLSRFIMGKTLPGNFIALKNSIDAAARTRVILEQGIDALKTIADAMPDLSPLAEKISRTIDDNPALSPEQGRVIREGYNPELDHLYQLKTNAGQWIIEYQEDIKKKLGIATLRVKYNRIHGYFIEVSKGQTSKVPDDFFRKQTLVGAERYTTPELQKFESEILSSSDKIIEMEKKEIEKLLAEILSFKDTLQELAAAVGETDFHCSLAVSAVENKFSRPYFNDRGIISLEAGRHPIVEKYFTSEVFIPNDVTLDSDENIIKIITGPNMSGKSTYIRMVAVIQLMAQTGSFVPARAASLGIVDRIFTRIGASDNISRGESTFLVEMNETAVILNNATDKSLIIMDEVGRGTSTYDGLSIAWAVVEYILRYLKAKTLFATHYHELTKLGSKKGIVNYNVLVRETINGVDFLHKVAPGAADKSYGIHVARLAGIPAEITSSAEGILDKMEKASSKNSSHKMEKREEEREQLDIFNAYNHRVIQAIKNIDLNNITPLEAINELNRLKQLID